MYYPHHRGRGHHTIWAAGGLCIIYYSTNYYVLYTVNYMRNSICYTLYSIYHILYTTYYIVLYTIVYNVLSTPQVEGYTISHGWRGDYILCTMYCILNTIYTIYTIYINIQCINRQSTIYYIPYNIDRILYTTNT